MYVISSDSIILLQLGPSFSIEIGLHILLPKLYMRRYYNICLHWCYYNHHYEYWLVITYFQLQLQLVLSKNAYAQVILI